MLLNDIFEHPLSGEIYWTPPPPADGALAGDLLKTAIANLERAEPILPFGLTKKSSYYHLTSYLFCHFKGPTPNNET